MVAIPAAELQWQNLPEAPTLPRPRRSGYAPVNGIKIWYAVFGSGEPVIMLHGGLGNSDYWGYQVPVLAKRHQVIVMDSRGHGRSTRDERPFGYDLMAQDVIGLMDFLKIRTAAIVGGATGQSLASISQFTPLRGLASFLPLPLTPIQAARRILPKAPCSKRTS